ncbi:GNAT family N-acetyltransferase [Microbacterium sp. NPDC079995]|uniref:GNAT family N-acetyltransferase n=1 Tax=unclassified Microbacterium TaxID=2609290 RepID=UPI003450F4C7
MIGELDLPVGLVSRAREVCLRRATEDDLDAIMTLLSDDPVSAGRGDVGAPDDRALYLRGLCRILDAEGNDLVVVEREGRVVGTLQLTVVPGMARRGSTRLMVEAVRVAAAERSAGIGAAAMRWVMDIVAPAVGASLVQLTSDAARTDAHRFYTRLGFADSHVGFKYRVAD